MSSKKIRQGLLLILPWLPASGMAIFPFILLHRNALPAGERLLNHERIHLQQQLELLILPFYLWYLLEYLYLLLIFKNHQQAYRNISFEKEAYGHEMNLDYLQHRKRWAFLSHN
ncbi:hypothetical protein BH11BAC2_BH11BAC2_15630 [soil metagenome]